MARKVLLKPQPDEFRSAFKVMRVENASDTDLIFTQAGRHIEALCGREHHRFASILEIAQEEHEKIFDIVNRKLCHDIKRTVRLGTYDSGYPAQLSVSRVTPFFVFLTHCIEVGSRQPV